MKLTFTGKDLYCSVGNVRPPKKSPIKIATSFYNRLVQQRHSLHGSKSSHKTINNIKWHFPQSPSVKAVTRGDVTGTVRAILEFLYKLYKVTNGTKKWNCKGISEMEPGGLRNDVNFIKKASDVAPKEIQDIQNSSQAAVVCSCISTSMSSAPVASHSWLATTCLN